MPVYLNVHPPQRGVAKRAKYLNSQGTPRPSLHIGLINNMPDGALRSTERQFISLLQSAAGNAIDIYLSYFSLPEVPRTDSARRDMSCYLNIETLWDCQLDGLIVTGAEPMTPFLEDEPFWDSLAKAIDWAEHNTYSSIWSCLAAHAAVLRIDGIERQRLRDKRVGVFECIRTSDHELMQSVPPVLQMPHSRWNDLSEEKLEDRGFSILTKAAGGVDTFVKQRKSLFVFFQGHPEYEANTLLLEYRRDVGRYLKGERDSYPTMPQGCFNRDIANAIDEFRGRALGDRRPELIMEFPIVLAGQDLKNSWLSSAIRLYANWLSILCTIKDQRQKDRVEERGVSSSRQFATAE